MSRRQARPVEGEPSPLRRARVARNWTLEDLVEEIDLRTPGGHSGVTPSMVSGWERGRHTTSIGHRKTLCEIYGEPPDALFAHQDEGLGARATPKLLAGFPDLQKAMMDTVADARECLVVLGSRSRDAGYLEAIETVMADRPTLVHYRVLFGPPHHRVLKDHLLRLLALRDPDDRSLGVKTLHLTHQMQLGIDQELGGRQIPDQVLDLGGEALPWGVDRVRCGLDGSDRK